MYRADPAYDGDPSALIAVAEALLKLGGAADRQLLLFVAEEPHTVAPLRAHLRRALARPRGADGEDGRRGERGEPRRLTVIVCRGPTCGDARLGGAVRAARETVAARGLEERVTARRGDLPRPLPARAQRPGVRHRRADGGARGLAYAPGPGAKLGGPL